MHNKSMVIIVTALIFGSTFFAVPHAYAASEPRGNGNIFSTMVNKLAQLFGGKDGQTQGQNGGPNDIIPPDDISGTPMQTPSSSPAPQQGKDMSVSQESRLTSLVKDGKITEAQKTAILAELKTIETKMKALQDELKAWAKAQGIDESYVMMGGGTPPQQNGQGGNTGGNMGGNPPQRPGTQQGK